MKNLNEDFNVDELLKHGYRESIMEGGFISPDCSTIVSVYRKPYINKVMQYSPNNEGHINNLELLRGIGAIE